MILVILDEAGGIVSEQLLLLHHFQVLEVEGDCSSKKSIDQFAIVGMVMTMVVVIYFPPVAINVGQMH